MNLYASTTLLWSKPVPEALQTIAEFGLNGAEIWSDQIDFHGTSIKEIQRRQKELPLSYTFHAPSWDINQISLNRGVRERSFGEIERSFEQAARLNTKNVTVHPGRLSLPNHWCAWHQEQQLIASRKLIGFANNYGVTLSLELMEQKPKELIDSPEKMITLLAAIGPSVKTTFDVAHIPLHKDVIEAYQATNRIGTIHLSDATKTTYHVALGDGEIDLDPIIELLIRTPLPIVLEGMDLRSDRMLRRHLAYLSPYLDTEREDPHALLSYK